MTAYRRPRPTPQFYAPLAFASPLASWHSPSGTQVGLGHG